MEIIGEPRIPVCEGLERSIHPHDANFMTSSRKKHASHTWRAILEGREALRLGLIRRIGDGNSTNIWQDRWIPNHYGGRPLSVLDNPQIQLVSELLTQSGAWNEELIKQVFISIDVQAILCTPIRGAGSDTWAWEQERHGMYTVKSAYRILYDEQERQRATGEASISKNKTWK